MEGWGLVKGGRSGGEGWGEVVGARDGIGGDVVVL